MDYTIDCENKRMGRVASEISLILQGKKNPSHNPRVVGQDRVILKNVNKLSLSGNKADQKIYYSHTTQIGHLKERKFKDVLAKHGMKYVLTKAVSRMLPKNRLLVPRMKRIIIAQ